jgi:hypothetical protein
MSLTPKIVTELNSLQAQVEAAQPLANAPHSTVVALQLNAINLLSDINTALAAAAGSLDGWVAPVDAPSIIKGILGIYQNAQDQRDLFLASAMVGRIVSNLEQL